MADRHDALVAASKVVLMVHDVTEVRGGGAGLLRRPADPGAELADRGPPPRAPGRGPALGLPGDRAAARASLLEDIAALAAEHDIRINVNDFDVRGIQCYPEDGLELTEKVAANLGLGVRRIRTMAGHDSVAMNRIVPTVMMFIPSVDGVSHCEREFTTDEDMVAGVDALTGVAWEMVNGALAARAAGTTPARWLPARPPPGGRGGAGARESAARAPAAVAAADAGSGRGGAPLPGRGLRAGAFRALELSRWS